MSYQILCVAALPPIPDNEASDEFVFGTSNGMLGVIARGEKSARFTSAHKGE